MAAEKRAEVTWRGDLMSGNGRSSAWGAGRSGRSACHGAARTSEGQVELTSLEELIAAAHAACSRGRLPTRRPKPGREHTRSWPGQGEPAEPSMALEMARVALVEAIPVRYNPTDVDRAGSR